MSTRQKLWLLLSALALLLTGAGITYAWFAQNAAMSTLMEVLPPDSITIVPVSGQTGSNMIDLDLDYHEDWGDKATDGRIYIQRYICVQSTSSVHKLEVAHTTNLQNLKFQIFSAVKKAGEGNSSEFTLEPVGTALEGKYINQPDENQLLAEVETLNNYQDDDTVESHAYPLYWLQTGNSNPLQSYVTTGYDPLHNIADQTFHNTYYCLKIDWQASSKETDLFYIIAENVA